MAETNFGFILEFFVALGIMGVIDGFFLIVYRCFSGRNCYFLSNLSGTVLAGFYIRCHYDEMMHVQLGFCLIALCQVIWYMLTYRRSIYERLDPLGYFPPAWSLIGFLGGIGIIVLGIIGYKSSSVFIRYLNSPYQRALTLVTDFIYQQQIGYPNLCHKYGYEMKIYPDYFFKQYRDDIDWIENELMKNGLSLKTIYELMYRTRGHKIERQLEVHLTQFKSYMIRNRLDERQISDSGGKYEKLLNDRLSMYEVCRVFDKTAPLLSEQQNQYRRFLDLMHMMIQKK